MTSPSRHEYTFDLPIKIGEGDGADTYHVKVFTVFDRIPDRKAPMLNVIEATVMEDKTIDESVQTLLEMTQDYLDDGGYDAALAFAERQRPSGNWE